MPIGHCYYRPSDLLWGLLRNFGLLDDLRPFHFTPWDVMKVFINHTRTRLHDFAHLYILYNGIESKSKLVRIMRNSWDASKIVMLWYIFTNFYIFILCLWSLLSPESWLGLGHSNPAVTPTDILTENMKYAGLISATM